MHACFEREMLCMLRQAAAIDAKILYAKCKTTAHRAHVRQAGQPGALAEAALVGTGCAPGLANAATRLDYLCVFGVGGEVRVRVCMWGVCVGGGEGGLASPSGRVSALQQHLPVAQPAPRLAWHLYAGVEPAGDQLQ